MNYSFYDEMDELDDILNESSDEEIFIESMEELFEEKATRTEYAMVDSKNGTNIIQMIRQSLSTEPVTT